MARLIRRRTTILIMATKTTHNHSKLQKTALTGCGLFVIAVAYYLWYEITGFAIPCLIHSFFHVYCPGCGVTRMLLAIVSLNFYEAFRYNPLLFLLLPVAIMLFGNYLYTTYKNQTPLYQKLPNSFWITLIIILIIYGVMRNLPWFSFLAPLE